MGRATLARLTGVGIEPLGTNLQVRLDCLRIDGLILYFTSPVVGADLRICPANAQPPLRFRL